MKILLVTETFLPSIDGVVTRLAEAVRYFNRQGHAVEVIAPDLGVKEVDGVPIHGIRPFRMPFYRNRPWGTPSRKVRRIMLDFQPDVVHVANPLLIGLSGVRYARELRLPLVVSYHTNLAKYLHYYNIDYPIVREALWRVERALHNRADINLCTSESMRQILVQHGIERVHVLQRGVDTVRRHPNYQNSDMRKLLSAGETDKHLLLFVGRVAAEKELDRLLPLMDRRQDVRLAIVGDGPDRERLEKLFVHTPTVFTGFLSGTALSQAYASADAFIFPSVSETLGLVILEAMASGLPVIAARSGPTLEQVREGENGLLFDAEDVGSLFEAVDCLENAALMEEMRHNVRREAERFAWSRTSRQLLDYYHIAIERARRKHTFGV